MKIISAVQIDLEIVTDDAINIKMLFFFLKGRKNRIP